MYFIESGRLWCTPVMYLVLIRTFSIVKCKRCLSIDRPFIDGHFHCDGDDLDGLDWQGWHLWCQIGIFVIFVCMFFFFFSSAVCHCILLEVVRQNRITMGPTRAILFGWALQCTRNDRSSCGSDDQVGQWGNFWVGSSCGSGCVFRKFI